MAQDIVNSNQSLSYTNLDFASIYTEVLDMVKQLTKDWDPSISDESDPGVVLVKLSALLADKCNYSIDKGTLEAFPLSVTQDSNARQLYEQLGYMMSWYQAATTRVQLTWNTTTVLNDDNDSVTYTIPKFTTITNDDEEIVYSLVGTEGDSDVVVSDGTLVANSSNPTTMIAYEGIPVQYTFNDSTTISASMVDQNNRLYLTTPYVFENGIFINNISQNNYAEWKKRDNLYEDSYDVKRYKFGYDSSSDLCYIEFPDNYAELFGTGIEIVYLTFSSTESYADAPMNYLTKFLSSVVPAEDSTVTLDTSNVSISNISAASGHQEKESINDAYTNYKKTVATFNTLITLRDYINYIKSNDLDVCSNAFVTDRTNDIQSSYKIISKKNDIESLSNMVEETDGFTLEATSDTYPNAGKTYYYIDNNNYIKFTGSSFTSGITYYEKVGDAVLEPFDLKFYLLSKAVAINSKTGMDSTFSMSTEPLDIDTLLDETSHLSLNTKDIESLDTSKIVLDRVYTLFTGSSFVAGTIYYEPSTFEKTSDTEPKSGKVYFEKTASGAYVKVTTLESGVTYYTVKTYIVTEDTTVQSGKYYFTISHEGTSALITSFPLMQHIVFIKNRYGIDLNIRTYDSTDSATRQDIINNVLTAYYSKLDSTNIEFGDSISLDYLTTVARDADSRIKEVVFNSINYYPSAIYLDESTGLYTEVTLPTKTAEWTKPQLDTNASMIDILSYLFGLDITAKSILAGTTQLLVPDDTFGIHLNNSRKALISNINYVDTEAKIDINAQDKYYLLGSGNEASLTRNYTLQDNELLTLYKPKLTDEQSFESGVHYEYHTNEDIAKNASYQLGEGENFIFYISNLNDDSELTSYTVYVYGKGTIINPTFKISKSTGELTDYGSRVALNYANSTGEINYVYTESASVRMDQITDSTVISNTKIGSNDTIIIQSMETLLFEQSDGYKFIWVLNNLIDNDGVEQYQLFDSYDSTDSEDMSNANKINSYTLKSGEVIYYTDSNMSNLGILGPGSTITRNCGVSSSIDTPVNNNPYVFVSANTIMSKGLGTINYTIKSTNSDGTSGVINVYDNGLYKYDSELDTYVRPDEDTVVNYTLETRTSGATYIKLATDYYLLVMRNVAGLYIDTTDTGIYDTQASDTTTTVFRSVDWADLKTLTSDINLADLGYFELIQNSNSVGISDTYRLATLDCEDSDDYFDNNEHLNSSGTYYRVVNTTDNSLFTSEILDGLDTSDVDTFYDLPSSLSPSDNNWRLIDSEGNISSDSSLMVDMDFDYSDTVNGSSATEDDYTIGTLYYRLNDNDDYSYAYGRTSTDYDSNYPSYTFTPYKPISTDLIQNLNTIYSLQKSNATEAYTNSKNSIELINAINNSTSLSEVSDKASNYGVKKLNQNSNTDTWGNESTIGLYAPLDTTDIESLTSSISYDGNIYFGFASDYSLSTDKSTSWTNKVYNNTVIDTVSPTNTNYQPFYKWTLSQTTNALKGVDYYKKNSDGTYTAMAIVSTGTPATKINANTSRASLLAKGDNVSFFDSYGNYVFTLSSNGLDIGYEAHKNGEDVTSLVSDYYSTTTDITVNTSTEYYYSTKSTTADSYDFKDNAGYKYYSVSSDVSEYIDRGTKNSILTLSKNNQPVLDPIVSTTVTTTADLDYIDLNANSTSFIYEYLTRYSDLSNVSSYDDNLYSIWIDGRRAYLNRAGKTFDGSSISGTFKDSQLNLYYIKDSNWSNIALNNKVYTLYEIPSRQYGIPQLTKYTYSTNHYIPTFSESGISVTINNKTSTVNFGIFDLVSVNETYDSTTKYYWHKPIASGVDSMDMSNAQLANYSELGITSGLIETISKGDYVLFKVSSAYANRYNKYLYTYEVFNNSSTALISLIEVFANSNIAKKLKVKKYYTLNTSNNWLAYNNINPKAFNLKTLVAYTTPENYYYGEPSSSTTTVSSYYMPMLYSPYEYNQLSGITNYVYDNFNELKLFIKITDSIRQSSFGQYTTGYEFVSYNDTSNKFLPLGYTAFDIATYSSLPITTATKFDIGEDVSGLIYTTNTVYDSTGNAISITNEQMNTHSFKKNMEVFISYMTYLLKYTTISNYGVFFMPQWYKLPAWKKYNDTKQYYIQNKYAKKTYNVIDPWVCTAVSANTLAEDSIEVLKKWFTNVQYNTSIGVVKNQLWTLTSGDTITFTAPVDDAENIEFPCFTNDETELDLSAYEVSYTKVGDDTVVLDQLDIEGYSWKGYSQLQLNTAKGVGQHLCSNHTIKSYNKNNELLNSTIGDATTYIQFSTPITSSVGDYLDVTSLDDDNNIIYNKMYIYDIINDKISSDVKDKITFVDDTNEIYMYFYRASTTTFKNPITLDSLCLPSGNYLIPINGSDNYTIRGNFTYTLEDDTTKTIQLVNYVDNTTYFRGDKLHFAKLVVPEEAETCSLKCALTLTLYDLSNTSVLTKCIDAQKDMCVIIDDIYKYEENTNYTSEQLEDIISHMKNLDRYEYYNYTHVIDDNDIISDPLASDSYWIENHILNPFTIAQFDSTKLTYKFLT